MAGRSPMAATRDVAAAPLPRPVTRWRGEPGTSGTVAVVGLGKIGLPLAAQYAAAGWRVIGVDVRPDLVQRLEAGDPSEMDEPGLEERLGAARESGRFRATLSHADGVGSADVVVIIVPLALSDASEPDYRALDAATAAVGAALRPGTLVVYETTLPCGDTRRRFGPALERASGLRIGDGDDGVLLAFSPERVFSGRVFRDLGTYPKLVGGVDDESTERATSFYRSVLPAEVRRLSSAEAAELAKLAETTYRDVNIALANELARYAERVGVDVQEVIAAANSQPFSHIHQPGLGVGGHCIPVYPHFLLARAPDLELVETARRVNQGQVGRAVRALEAALGSLEGVEVLVLGLTYREGVKELAHSRALALLDRLRFHGARVAAYDPLLSAEEVAGCCAEAWGWGTTSGARAIVVQTADARFRSLDPAWFPALEVFFDGRNALRDLALPEHVRYLGVGVPARASRRTAAAAG